MSPRFAAVVVYDDGVQRPLEINRQSGAIDTHVNVIEFSFSADILYGRSHASRVDYSNEKDLSSRTRFYRIAVNEDGVSVLNDTVDALPDGLDLVDMQFDDGLIYTEDGALIDPEGRSIGGLLLGTFEPRATWDTRWLVEPDSELRLVYYLRDGVLRVFDTDTFALLGSLIVPQASGTAGSLILAGSETLAFRTDEDQVFLISKQAVKEMLAGVEK